MCVDTGTLRGDEIQTVAEAGKILLAFTTASSDSSCCLRSRQWPAGGGLRRIAAASSKRYDSVDKKRRQDLSHLRATRHFVCRSCRAPVIKYGRIVGHEKSYDGTHSPATIIRRALRFRRRLFAHHAWRFAVEPRGTRAPRLESQEPSPL